MKALTLSEIKAVAAGSASYTIQTPVYTPRTPINVVCGPFPLPTFPPIPFPRNGEMIP